MLSVVHENLYYVFLFFFFLERFGFNSPSQRRFIKEQIKILVSIIRTSGWFRSRWAWNSLEKKDRRCRKYGKNRLRSLEQRQRTTGLYSEVNEVFKLTITWVKSFIVSQVYTIKKKYIFKAKRNIFLNINKYKWLCSLLSARLEPIYIKLSLR